MLSAAVLLRWPHAATFTSSSLGINDRGHCCSKSIKWTKPLIYHLLCTCSWRSDNWQAISMNISGKDWFAEREKKIYKIKWITFPSWYLQTVRVPKDIKYLSLRAHFALLTLFLRSNNNKIQSKDHLSLLFIINQHNPNRQLCQTCKAREY